MRTDSRNTSDMKQKENKTYFKTICGLCFGTFRSFLRSSKTEEPMPLPPNLFERKENRALRTICHSLWISKVNRVVFQPRVKRVSFRIAEDLVGEGK
ncbi:hypothetical protein CDAR_614741 [Caerostris darwini]|uniref:Uncharacterized protein n=1 Tax=Caerostris darwini TaxID=1538125 RepID=A0AAV4TLY9_9ARAC|nr:hypothetical protein CDAR_614741 [Caerostris darwini]